MLAKEFLSHYVIILSDQLDDQRVHMSLRLHSHQTSDSGPTLCWSDWPLGGCLRVPCLTDGPPVCVCPGPVSARHPPATAQ